MKGIVTVASEGCPPIPLFARTHTHSPPPTYPIHAASLCHLSLSIKNVLSPESGPIKGRIPGRRADKAYLINKCFTIVGARAPRHTLPASLWYLIIHPFHSVREGGEGRLVVSSQPNTVACVCVCVSGSGQGAAPNIMTCSKSKHAESGTCKQMQIRCCCKSNWVHVCMAPLLKSCHAYSVRLRWREGSILQSVTASCCCWDSVAAYRATF